MHRSAGARGADRARVHAAHLRCLAPAGGQRGCTGQQEYKGRTERGSTPLICAVSRQQGDSAVAPVSRRTRGGQSEGPRRSFALSRASRGTARLHRPAGARGADRARVHAAHLRCLALAGGTARLHRPAGVQGADRARVHAAHLRCLAPAGGQRGCTGQQAHAGRTERGSTPLICAVSRQQGGQRGCTGQQEYKGRTERGSTPSICAIPRQRGGTARLHRSAGRSRLD